MSKITPTSDGTPLFSETHKRNTGRWWITDQIIYFYYWIIGYKMNEDNLETIKK